MPSSVPLEPQNQRQRNVCFYIARQHRRTRTSPYTVIRHHGTKGMVFHMASSATYNVVLDPTQNSEISTVATKLTALTRERDYV